MSDPAPTPTAADLGAALQPKHRQFCDTYLTNGLNALAAAREMGYKQQGEGHRLLQREDISVYVRARLDEAGLTTAEITRRLQYFAEGDMRDFLTVAPSERSYWIRADQHEEVREAAKRRGTTADALDNYELAGILGSDRVAQTEDGVLMVCVREVDAEVIVDWRSAERLRALGRIKKIKIGKEGAVEFELHDPVRALELLGKAQKMFTDKVELGGEGGGPVQVQITRRIVGGEGP